MRKLFSAILLLFGIIFVDNAQAVVVNGYNYIRFCIPGNACVINRISQETGISIYLIKDEAKAKLQKYAQEKEAAANGGGSSSGGTGLPPGGVFTGVNPGPNIPGSVYKCQGTAVGTVEAGVDTSPDATIICGWVYENQQ